jgi:hypothetical protein
MSNEILSSTPSLKDATTPLEKFTGVKVQPKLNQFHTFGCPAYVLNNTLQSGRKAHKWVERSRVGIYLGPSLQHSRSIGLILSLTTGNVSPQFHVTYDDGFKTTRGSGSILPASNWQRITGFVLSKDRPSTHKATVPTPQSRLVPPDTVSTLPLGHFTNEQVQVSEGNDLVQAAAEQDDSLEAAGLYMDDEGYIQIDHDQATPSLRRSKRTPVPSVRFLESLETADQVVAFETLLLGEVQSSDEEIHPLIAFATSSDPDVMNLTQALQQHDKKEFVKAMIDEVDAQVKNKFWEIVPRISVPRGMKVLPAVWSMRRTRRIDTREVYKHKARLTVHGGRQEYGVNYWETYSPVVMWASIRLFLVLTMLAGWKTR